jgi:pimeloyl-ACP methyl ester carboxylesterase
MTRIQEKTLRGAVLPTLLLGIVLATCADGREQIRTGSAVSPDGVNIFVRMMGEEEPTLVFVHGWSCDGSYWNNQLKHFAAENRTVLIDLAGHGASHRNRRDYSMTAFAGDVVAVLEEWNLRKVILIGHSMGGAVIVEAALAAPGRVIGLVGVDNFHDVAGGTDPEQVAAFVDSLAGDFRNNCYRFVKTMFPAAADSALIEGIAIDMATAPSDVALSAIREFLGWSSTEGPERLRQLKVPLVCINSDLEPTDAKAMKSLVPGYRLKIMPARGHFLMLEDPDGFNRILAGVIATMTKD